MSNDQQTLGFDEEPEEEYPRKTLYDKILEQQEEAASGKREAASGKSSASSQEIWEAASGKSSASSQEISDEVTRPPSYQATEPPPPPVVPVVAATGGKPKSKRNKTLNIIFIILFSVMAVVIGFLVYTLLTEREETEEMRVTLEFQKESLTNELNELYASYDSLQTTSDSMNVLIEERQKEIRSLLAIRESNAKKIRIYDEQVKSLRDVLKSYIFQVDSLNQANLRLQAENRAQQSQIRDATNANRQLEQVNRNLQGQVEKAAVVKAIMVRAEPIDDAGAIARRLRRTDKFRVCFSLAANAVAESGLKQIYIRIANPNELVLVKNVNQTFVFQGESIPYSAAREVEYEKDELEVCIFYDAIESEVMAGTYYVDVYMDGAIIGTTSFSLR